MTTKVSKTSATRSPVSAKVKVPVPAKVTAAHKKGVSAIADNSDERFAVKFTASGKPHNRNFRAVAHIWTGDLLRCTPSNEGINEASLARWGVECKIDEAGDIWIGDQPAVNPGNYAKLPDSESKLTFIKAVEKAGLAASKNTNATEHFLSIIANPAKLSAALKSLGLSTKENHDLQQLFSTKKGIVVTRDKLNRVQGETVRSCSKIGGYLTQFFGNVVVGPRDKMMWIGTAKINRGTEYWIMRPQIRTALEAIDWQ